MAAVTQTTEPEKNETMPCEDEDSNNEEPEVEEDEEENEEEENGEGEEEEEEEEEEEVDEAVKVGSVYPCKRADGTQHDAEIVKTRKNKRTGKEEYYVHYVSLNRRQSEWVDKTRLVLSKSEVKEDAEEEQHSTDQEMTDITEQPESNTSQSEKQEPEDSEPEPKRTKLENKESSLNTSVVAPDSDIAEELTCPLCRELFKDPVMVECGHNFCRSCFDISWEGRELFSCPECKEVISERKCSINRALAILVKKSGTTPVKPAVKKVESVENCPEHDERLKLYCNDDGMLGCVICRDSLKHAGHNFLPILDAVNVCREKLSVLLAPLESAQKMTEKLASEQNEKIVQHKKTVTEYKEHIVSEFEKMHKFLHEREKSLLDQLQEQGDSLLKKMEDNIVRMEEEILHMKKTIAMANERLDDSDPISFLADMKTLIDKCLKQQQDVASSGISLISKELCKGTFKAPFQYIVWRQMKSYIDPNLTPVTLDADTAHANLLLSYGLTNVKYCEKKYSIPDNPKRFNNCIHVLGSEGFDSGRHYWEVEVGNKTAWDVGMASESSNRKGNISLRPKDGYWALWLRNNKEYKALDSPSRNLVLPNKPKKIGVYLDYEGGILSFYNADDMTRIYTFKDRFTEKMYPFLSPYQNDYGRNTDALRLVQA
ncbi:nuclear factor 7, brain-like [Rhinophrynus dorsalis]